MVPSCQGWQKHPVAGVNSLLLWNVCVLFWGLSLLQNSTWLIDPYWTLIPPFIEAYYATHPAATGSSRSNCAAVLVAFWSLRLSYSYLRREGWQLGAREDWRFADMRKKYGRNWWWMSFFLAYISQHFMLLGLTLPLYSSSFSAAPWHWRWDGLAVAMCLSGLLTAYVSDTALHGFVQAKKNGAAADKPQEQLLQTGLWHHSRHPNHVGEQLFWWGLAMFAVSSGDYWTLIGPLFNTICMVQVTRLVEERMLKQPGRAAAYRQYQQTTPMWFPGVSTFQNKHVA
ncbi:hypothetical protein ABBQ38_005471 [Trebouxia sp. C0009 RCD-2024]